MSQHDSDPDFTPPPVRVAMPLFRQFRRSTLCAPEHRWHVRTTLPVLALFVAMTGDFMDDEHLDWGSLCPDSLVAASLEIEPGEDGFLRDLLDVSAGFYAFLGQRGHVPQAKADRIRARLVRLALGLQLAA